MGRKSASGGVAEHNGKIRLDIWYRGKRLRPVLDTEWNERNRRAALRMVGEIRGKIRHGLFDPADYFPEYSGLETLTAPSALSTFRDYAQAWLRSLGQKAMATREDYRRALDRVWLDELGERPIRAIRYSELMTLIGNLAVAGKTLNNYLIPDVINDLPSKVGLDFDMSQITFAIYGFLLLMMMILRPQGLIPERRHKMELAEHADTTDENLYTARA